MTAVDSSQGPDSSMEDEVGSAPVRPLNDTGQGLYTGAEPVPFWPLLLYFLSGFTALAYEVLWMRLVSTLSGASTFGLVTTLIAFMSGLGLGSIIGARLRLSPQRSLLLFAALESGVALLSLVLPDAAQWMERGFEAMAGVMGSDGWVIYHVIACLLLLLLPATALGLTFPAMLRALATTDAGVARIYGYNTLGGVLGALAPMLLLPWLGWAAALRMIAGVGLLTGAAAIAISMLWRQANAGTGETPVAPRPDKLEMLAYAGVGAAALMLEVGWTRIYGAVFMRTEYILAVILATVLLGIALGSLLSRRMGENGIDLVVILAVPASLLPLALLPRISAWMETLHFSSLDKALAVQALVTAAVTVPATLALGAWLPIISRRQDREISAAWFYGANSLGAALGASIAGWLVIPLFGSSAAVCVAASLLALCGLYWCAYRVRILLLLVLPAVVLLWTPSPVPVLLPHQYGDARELFHHEDAVSMTDVVAHADGRRVLLNDLQRLDASTDPTAVTVQLNQGRLPLLLRPHAKRVLFLGLGTGITAAPAHRRNGTFRFAANAESLAFTIASLVAIAFENAELHQAALEKQRYEREIELAAEIQRGLLPREIPSIPGYRFLGFTRPSREIGGDLYDIIDLGQGRIAAVVADVTGKGVPAALLVSTLHAGLHLLEEELHDPLTVVHKLNRLICHSSAGNKFITMVLFVLDTRTHRLLAVNAGHNHPVILLPHGEIRRIPAGGIPLGILEQMRYESAELQLPPGALVLAFTDGISETRDPQGDEFGERRLIELIRAHPPGEGETLAQELLGRLADFRGCDAQEDDITCLLLQRLPESSEQAPAVQGPPG